ncbi:MAG: aminotransferase class V-fold PLP-dependent enzyme [Myxococcota bacterium]
MRDAWALDDSIHFLNHGSYGATPRVVLARQQALRDQLEREPVRFMARELEPLLDEARARVAAFVGADPRELVFVTNATTGVNAVLRSLRFEAGDELLTTSHGYNACLNVLRFVAEQTGARVVIADVPLPTDAAAIERQVLARVGPKTKLVLLDQITSPTALVFPVERLIAQLEGRGVPVLVDAAHATGQVPLDLRRTGASFTTGNLHKWVCAPKGAAFLHVRRDWQERIRPPVISHGANSPRTDRSRFQLEFDWVGTADPTAVLAVPAALDFMGALLPGGWPALMEQNRADALAARAQLLDALGTEPICPPELVGAMAAVPLRSAPKGLQDRLFHEHRIEVPIIPFGDRTLVRVSMQRHVRPGDLAVLLRALQETQESARPGVASAQ